MSHRTETAEFTVLCLIRDQERILLQDRVSEDWKGYTRVTLIELQKDRT